MKRINPFNLDWTNLEQVKRYADTFGPGFSVILHRGRDNYNIRHTSRVHEVIPYGAKELYRTGDKDWKPDDNQTK
jgi:hypothetical protein